MSTPPSLRSGEPVRPLSVLILTREEATNLTALLPAVAEAIDRAGVPYELVIVDADSPDGTAEVAERHGARVVRQSAKGYANALRQGFRECAGEYVLTLDADLSHRPELVGELLRAAEDADLVIASRYVAAGRADMPGTRRALSVALNRVFGTALGVPTRDMSSGFRLYRRRTLMELAPLGDHFDVLPEIVALSHFSGHRVREVPFHYRARADGVSKARVLQFGPSYARTLVRCWRERARRRVRV